MRKSPTDDGVEVQVTRVNPFWLLLSCDGKPLDMSSTPYQPQAIPWFQDVDGDGYGNPDASRFDEERPNGFVDNNLDCDDQNIDIHPGASERCDPGDEDCDGLVDDNDPELTPDRTFWADPDGDGLGDPLSPRDACNLPAGFVDNDDDCSPQPLAVDWVDGVDDDCDGRIDVQGSTFGTWWYTLDPIRRHVHVGDTTLWLTSNAFVELVPEISQAQLYVLRDEDVDFEQPLISFDEILSLGPYGDIALAGTDLWMRSDDALYLVDPTIRGLSPAVSTESISPFLSFPFAVGDFDGDGAAEIAAGAPPVVSLYGFVDSETLSLVPEDTAYLQAFDLITARFGATGDDLLVRSAEGLSWLAPGQWSSPQLLTPFLNEIAVGDIDGDGLSDVAFCGFSDLEVLLGANAGEWDGPDLSYAGLCYDVAIADVTGDGFDDLWIANPSESALFAGGPALPSIIDATDRLFVVGDTSFAVEAGDIDGDGLADLGTRSALGWRWFSGLH